MTVEFDENLHTRARIDYILDSCPVCNSDGKKSAIKKSALSQILPFLFLRLSRCVPELTRAFCSASSSTLHFILLPLLINDCFEYEISAKLWIRYRLDRSVGLKKTVLDKIFDRFRDEGIIKLFTVDFKSSGRFTRRCTHVWTIIGSSRKTQR